MADRFNLEDIRNRATLTTQERVNAGYPPVSGDILHLLRLVDSLREDVADLRRESAELVGDASAAERRLAEMGFEVERE